MKDRPQLLSKTMGRVLQRADEPAEFLALYWKDRKQPLSKQVKRGLAWSMRRFSEYDLARYNRDSEITPRDVLFMSHARPKDEAQAALWKKLAANELATPDTWEVQLSAGADKKETFERLIREKKLGYFALIRNLRNMEQAGVDV
jgi:60 kDa SS-A/Ro ribonucleoprotein